MIVASPATTETGLEDGGVEAEDHTVNDEAIMLSGFHERQISTSLSSWPGRPVYFFASFLETRI